VVDFTIDDNGNYWQLSAFDFSIFNSNDGGVNMGKSSVIAQFLQSNSIPGAYLFFPQFLPIYSSIKDFSDIYPPLMPGVTISVGKFNLLQLPEKNYDKYSFIISPGYKLVVTNNYNTIVLDVQNLSVTAICCRPEPAQYLDSYLASCNLFFYSNNNWIILPLKS
jgi:hypothetical protein